jgi:hypothetical protein
MTIPWNEQSSLSVANAEPVRREPVNKREITPPLSERNQPEYSDIHQDRNSSPGGISDLSRGVTPSRSNSISFDFCLFGDLPLKFYNLSFECSREESSLAVRNPDSFANREKKYQCGFFNTPLCLFKEIYQSKDRILNQSETWRLVRQRSEEIDFGFRSWASITLRLSVLVFLLCALDTGSSLQFQRNVSPQRAVVWNTFPSLYSIQNCRGSEFQKRVQLEKVWCNPRQDSRTVGKHRCHCTKNSFFISHHNISENLCCPRPVKDDCLN